MFKKLDITHHIPLLLTGAIRYGEGDHDSFERLLDSLISFCFRYFTIGNRTVADLEKQIGLMSKYLRNPLPLEDISENDEEVKTIQNLQDVIDYMCRLTPDLTFVNNFELFSTRNNTLGFYILNELEKQKRSGVRPLNHGPNQHIEHIMPKRPSKAQNRMNEWSSVRNSEDYNEFKYRVGNLLIIERELNQRAKNYDFSTKKEVYEESGLYYPSEIINLDEWDFQSIEKRQKQMAQDALQVCNYSE
ncbi:HNH endonuclease family protein [Halobacillus faecis]|uniref:GmrSD restriction endonucleases C-terminal domain-containing protein n=1 Tax=Halobacillus faecis TaxID=360184 RepID=A0A511WT18_9BACI|nr:HNH endonuclease family protein [Halobacillus faecis]GEN52422.1 hypothetical protein HFA01_06840 [Halobacillus faecis]